MRFKRFLFGIIGIILVLVCINTYLQLFLFNIKVCHNTSINDLSVMTYNVAALDTNAFSPKRQQDILSILSKNKPNILCLQELSFENLYCIKPSLDSIYGPCDLLKGDDQLWRLMFYFSYPIRNFQRYYCTGELDTTGFDEDVCKNVNKLKDS